jgi:hypothetical protein
MNIYNSIDDIDPSNTFFFKPIENKLSCYKLFYKIAYNIDNFVLNTILININISTFNIIREQNTYKATIYLDNNFLLKLKDYEINILSNINKIINKQYVLSSHKYILNNILTYTYNYKPTNIKLFLRISGIWESDTQYGLITKIHHYPSTLKF